MPELSEQFEERVRSVYPVAYARALRIVTQRELAEDVLQEALTRAWQARQDLRDESRFEAWFLRIVTREAVAAARALRLRRHRYTVPPVELNDLGPDPAQAVESAEQARMVWQAVADLSPRQRAVFSMCVVEGLRLREAAICLGITTGAAKRHLSRARDRLRKRLARS